MNTHNMLFTSEEMLLIRDALDTEYHRLRDHKGAMDKAQGASERLMRNVALLEGLKDTFKSKCARMRG